VKERVVRYDKEHKQVTRQRIIQTAGRRLKRDGIDGSGVATLMADAGLTNGAFYAHFSSKDDLVATVITAELRVQCEGLGELPPGRDGIEQLARFYLSAGHRDNPQDGCPSAALLEEIGRGVEHTRRTYTDGMMTVADSIAARLAPDDPQPARVKALSIVALMAGTLQMARAMADHRIADAILDQGIENTLTLLGTRDQA
jgi:AcrR family transcriptional regulator